MEQKRPGQPNLTELIPKNWSVILILFLAILGSYYQSLTYPFLNLDDPYYISANPFIRELTWEGVYKIFSRPIVDNYFPLQILTYAFDYQVWHVQPFGYRLHNVILHVLNAALVFLLLKKIFSNIWVSALAALLFGLHPVNVESVTWVAERKNVLSLAFMLSSFLSYLYYLETQRQTRKAGFYLAALCLFLLALLAKVSAVVLPLLFILYDFSFLRRGKWEMVRDKLPFLALALLFSVLTVWIYHSGKYLVDYHGGTPYHTFLAMINVFVEYIIYLIIPLYLDHYYDTPIPRAIFEPQVLLSFMAIFLFILFAWRSSKKDRVFFFWFGWFFISLLPVLNIVPITILRADRYMYLPAIGFFYFASRGLWKIAQGVGKPLRPLVFLSCSLLVVGTYSFLTQERNKVWKDPITFWEASLKKFPQSATPYKYIGNLYGDCGKVDLAILYFQEGLRQNPDNVTLMNGLALAYKSKNDLKRAEELLLQANRLNPMDSGTYNNLGAVYYQKGEMERSRTFLQKALALDPKNVSARTNLGVIFYTQNQWEEAIREYEKAIEDSPSSIEPHLNLALIYEKKVLFDKAKSYLEKGLDYNPRSHAALFMIARISFAQGKIPEARYYLKQAYRVNPDDRDTRHFMELLAQAEANPSLPQKEGLLPPSPPKAMESPIPKHRGRENL